MRIRRNLRVSGHQRAFQHACSSDEQLISRIAVERAWQLSRFHHYTRRELQQLHARFGEGIFNPKRHRPIQFQSFVLYELRYFPT